MRRPSGRSSISANNPATGPQPPTSRRHLWLIIKALARTIFSVTALMMLYFLLPFDQELDKGAAAWIGGGLIGFVGLIAWQLRAVLQADFPGLRAAETFAIAVPVFLLCFSTGYYLMDQSTAGSFTEALSRVDSLYFTVTVFATVGFGDITPVTTTARVATIVQMISGLLVISLLARVLVGAVQRANTARAAQASTTTPTNETGHGADSA